MSINKKLAASIWGNVGITVERFTAKIALHEKSQFLGYASVKVEGRPGTPVEGFCFYLNGVGVKILKGNPYVEMPTEKAANGTYYDRFAPGTAETRAVLTTAIFRDENVQAAIQTAGDMVRQAQGAGAPAEQSADANPFGDRS
jgi:DNA-binding cell septation regulator SpoVG